VSADQPPVTKYELTVKIRGNTHDEIEDELLTLVRGGYLLDSDYGKRDAWNSTGGRCTSVMVHTNPEQTPRRMPPNSTHGGTSARPHDARPSDDRA
jgi:putative lipoic acid-binding regulatory protein